MVQKFILSILTITLVCSACSNVKRMEQKPQVTTTPERLELFVDQKTDPYVVRVDYTLNIPGHYVPSCGQLIYAPRFVAPGYEYALKPVVVSGKNFRRLDQRMQLLGEAGMKYTDTSYYKAEKNAMHIEIREIVPFMLWMPQSELVATVSLRGCKREAILYTQTLAKDMVYMPLGPGPVRVKYVTKKIKEQKQQLFSFFYAVNESQLNPAFGDNFGRLEQLKKWIEQIQQDSAVHLEKIILTGTGSPSGNRVYNEKLATERAVSVKDYLLRHFPVSQYVIVLNSIAEDWEGLAKVVSDSALPGKQRILRILHSSSTASQKEALLKELPDYSFLRQHFFPALRRVDCEIEYTILKAVQEIIPE